MSGKSNVISNMISNVISNVISIESAGAATRMGTKVQDVPVDRSGVDSHRTPRRVYQRTIGLLRHGQYRLVQAVQLSEGGLLFKASDEDSDDCSDEYKENDNVVVNLILPHAGFVILRAVVVDELREESGSKQYGVRFAALSLQQRRQIRNYVAAKTQEEAESEA